MIDTLPDGIEILSPAEATADRHLKIMVHGPPKVGKTTLAATTCDDSRVIILDTEGGTLSLRDKGVRVIPRIDSTAKLRSAVRWLSANAEQFDWVILDSLSELAELTLAQLKREHKDPRKAYGELTDTISGVFRFLLSLPIHVVFICKQGREQLDDGRVLFVPKFPGKQLTQGLGYLADLVLALRVDGGERYLQTRADGTHEAGDRSGKLAAKEPPSLQIIKAKILGGGLNE